MCIMHFHMFSLFTHERDDMHELTECEPDLKRLFSVLGLQEFLHSYYRGVEWGQNQE